ncbi:CpsD/CapB family tyrosine-protein kinase [Alkalihalobacillus macyae]|uniref:CpsD/CapB family tyrosine-protein kinase n=1 Tax=Guptibacillus hwajinpoensis TaxID=208199 RepID=UPI00273C53C8|nr:CpsD/CapB family tyrosine-protein kinase [Alkalihalobacillus macyae]MDP4552609.1 CpsD/CapB family tyrosine-protein kinase [Alkalihalobacillus macyae]
MLLKRMEKIKAYKQLSEVYESTEQMRLACRNLQHVLSLQQKNQFLMIASSTTNQNKSLIAVKLAASFAEQGRKVLLVDTDFRNPSLNGLFEIENQQGFTNMIGGQLNAYKCIVKTRVPYLHVVPAGSHSYDSFRSSLLNRFQLVREQWSLQYDLVLFVSPSLTISSESYDLLSVCDGVVYVAKEYQTTNEEISLFRKEVERADNRMLGVIYQTN